jgi:MFS family permease
MDYDHFPPGTVRLLDDHHDDSAQLLKKHGDIVLSPQPTNSVNDPLNWSRLRKYWHTVLLCFIVAFTAATSNDAGSAQYGENIDLGISYSNMNTGAGVLFVGIGYFTLLISPAAALYGRRITYLVCITLGLIGAVWMANVERTSDSIWNQLFVGASEACAEANVQLSLSDMFFQHQLGSVLGAYVLATSIGTFMGPLIAGYIADSSEDWRWIGWWSVIISTGLLVVLFFSFEDTAFDRRSYSAEVLEGVRTAEPRDPNRIGAADDTSSPAYAEKDPAADVNMSSAQSAEEQGTFAHTLEGKPKSFRQRIALITPAPNIRGTGFKQYMARLWCTLRIFSFPAVIYSGLQWGGQDAWLTFYLTVEEDNWYDAPWYYSDAQVGVMNVPSLIGAIIGCFYGGVFSDYFVAWMAKKNGGISEAEHRLWLMYPCALISPLGMLLFGIGTGQGWTWPVPYVGLALIGFGWGCAGDLSMAYLMDAYPEMVLEGMVGVSVINNTIGCIFTFVASEWLAAAGVQDTFIVIAVLDFAIIMMTLPMMIYGKRSRVWTTGRYLDFVKLRDSL